MWRVALIFSVIFYFSFFFVFLFLFSLCFFFFFALTISHLFIQHYFHFIFHFFIFFHSFVLDCRSFCLLLLYDLRINVFIDLQDVAPSEMFCFSGLHMIEDTLKEK